VAARDEQPWKINLSSRCDWKVKCNSCFENTEHGKQSSLDFAVSTSSPRFELAPKTSFQHILSIITDVRAGKGFGINARHERRTTTGCS